MEGIIKKRIVMFLILVSLSVLTFAQKQKPKNESWYDEKVLHFGFTLGFNTMDFKITPSNSAYMVDSLIPEVTSLNPGINIQIVTDFKPARYLDIRFLPGVSFGQRNVVYYKGNKMFNDKQTLESSFIEFPLIFKYKAMRLNNVRPYLVGGFNYRYDLAGKKEYDEDKPVYIRLKRGDLNYEVGTGMDFYLSYFKLSVEMKMSNGMRDLLVHEPAPGHSEYSDAIEKMKSQIWILSFHFE